MDLALREGVEGELGERRPAPRVQRESEQAGPLLWGRSASSHDRSFEAPCVDVLALDREHVAGRACLERLGADHFPELRDGILEGASGRVRRMLSPQLVDKPVGRHDAARVQKQNREEHPLALAAECDGAVDAFDLERAQYPEVERDGRH